MKILTLHCDYIRFKPNKKALKDAEELSEADKKEKEIKECLVVLTSVEQGDNSNIIKQLVEAVEKTASEVKTNSIVLYPYAHLSSNLAKPVDALALLKEAESQLKKKFKTTRAPFGYYKTFEFKCKGHPLAELSKEFHSTTQSKPGSVVAEENYDTSKLLREISRTKLDTSKLRDNDHRILGQRLDLFSFNESAPGQPFWHPSGLVILNSLIDYWRKLHQKAGYQEILTPQVLDNKVWKVSGHWRLYKENMFITNYEGRDFALKPMSCPGAMLVYKTKMRSYNELPLRFSEVGVVHRQELSGVISGLLRVIRITQDDAHLFVTREQLADEIVNVLKLFKELLDQFRFEYKFTISVRSKEKKDKYLGDDTLWNEAEKALAEGLKKLKAKYEIVPGEAKFYGPSLDILIKDSLGREWQCSTLQLDFNSSKNFELSYTGSDGKEHTPIVLHHVVYGSLERFIGVLLEHLNGNLPLWLSPRQVRVINFTDRNTKACEKFVSELKKEIPSIIVETDFRNDTVQSKIRDAELMKVNHIIVIGDKEEKTKTLAVRPRGGKPKFGIKVGKFIEDLKKELENKTTN